MGNSRKTHLKKWLAALLAVGFILLPGCEKQDDSSSSTPMGRYVEQDLTLPLENFYQISYFQRQPDDSLLLMGFTTDSDTSPYQTAFKAWRSKDSGASWQQEDFPWLKTINESELSVLNVFFDQELNPYIYYWPAEPEEITPTTGQSNSTPEQAPSSSAPEAEEEPAPLELVARVTPDGIEPLDFQVRSPDVIKVMEDGSLLYSNYEGLYRAQEGKEEELVHSSIELILSEGSFFFDSSTIWVTQLKNILLYDAVTLEEKEELSLTIGKDTTTDTSWKSGTSANQSAIYPGLEAGSVCYANSSGIYQITPDGKLNERIVDGTLNSLCIPTLSVMGLFPQNDNSYLVCFVDAKLSGKISLKRYYYDKNIIASPTTELRVFSIFDSPTIRQAVGTYQIQNPDVRINYEIGYEPGSQDMSGDVVNGLNTSLLAGDGPDVLILDRLSVAEYADKGMLEDLAPLLEPEVIKSLLPGPAATYSQGETTYAIPARFTLPMLFGSQELVNNCQTAPGLVQTMAQAENPMLSILPEDLVFELYPFYQDRWYPDQKTLNWANLEADLIEIEQLAQRYREVTLEYADNTMIHIGGNWASGTLDLGLTKLTTMEDLVVPFSSGQVRQGGMLVAFPQQEKPAFTPQVIMSIYSGSSNKELATSFIQSVLSPENQAQQVGDGLPVNREALLQNQIYPREQKEYNSKNHFGTFGTFSTNPYTGEEKELTIEVFWPDESYFTSINQTFNKMDTPLLTNLTMQEIIAVATQEYMAGNKSLEDTMAELEKTLNIYLAEQEV